MLQVFYLDIAYVALAIHVCCKCFIWMLHMLQCPYTYVASVCCKCFINFGRMLQQMLFTLQVFHLQARLVSAGRGGPLGRSGPRMHKAGRGAQSWARSTKLGMEHEAACMLGCSLSLSPYSSWMWLISSSMGTSQSARPGVARRYCF